MEGFIQFNNLISSELGLVVNDVQISQPNPILITESIPYSNEYFDFSSSVGTTKYEQREIIIKFSFFSFNRQFINIKNREVATWLYSANKSKLKIDFIQGYFNARVTNILNEHSEGYNYITVTFIADPFIICDAFGADIWDNFNFITDVTENNVFNVTTNRNIELINTGIPVSPKIITSSSMKIRFEGTIFSLKMGINNIPYLYLKNGLNSIEVIEGSGTLEFIFNKINL